MLLEQDSNAWFFLWNVSSLMVTRIIFQNFMVRYSVISICPARLIALVGSPMSNNRFDSLWRKSVSDRILITKYVCMPRAAKPGIFLRRILGDMGCWNKKC